MTKFTSYTTGLLVIVLMSCDTGNAAESAMTYDVWDTDSTAIARQLAWSDPETLAFQLKLDRFDKVVGGINMQLPLFDTNGGYFSPPERYGRILHQTIIYNKIDSTNVVLDQDGLNVNLLDSDGRPALFLVLHKQYKTSQESGCLGFRRKKAQGQWGDIAQRLIEKRASVALVQSYLDRHSIDDPEKGWIDERLTQLSSRSPFLA